MKNNYNSSGISETQNNKIYVETKDGEHSFKFVELVLLPILTAILNCLDGIAVALALVIDYISGQLLGA